VERHDNGYERSNIEIILTRMEEPMTAVIYNCKRCKRGRRVEYPEKGYDGRPYRLEGLKSFQMGVWVKSCGGGKPTQYSGDPLGICDGCGNAMQYGELRATVRPEIACDARCMGARGHSCDCSCGGKNHGAGWQIGRPFSTLQAA